jgi:hypothetical protein
MGPLEMSRQEREAVEQRRAAALEALERLDVRRAWIILGIVLVWFAVGAGLLAWSFHVDGPWGPVLFWGGLVVGNAGAFYTWFFVYVWQQD